MPSLFRRLALVAVLALATASQPALASASGLTADLAGAPLALAEVGSYYCHDLDYPRIHCFRTLRQVEASADAMSAGVLSVAAATSAQYLRVYDLQGYAGPSMIMSANYNDLGTIGWNDRISSYVALNGLSFGLWTNTMMTGNGLLGCCSQSASSLPSGYDNQISSVQQR